MKILNTAAEFRVFHQRGKFRICTVTRIKPPSKSNKEVILIRVDPKESIAIEIENDITEKEGKKNYLVLSFIKKDNTGRVFISPVGNRIQELSTLNKIKYKMIEKKAIRIFKKGWKNKI